MIFKKPSYTLHIIILTLVSTQELGKASDSASINHAGDGAASPNLCTTLRVHVVGCPSGMAAPLDSPCAPCRPGGYSVDPFAPSCALCSHGTFQGAYASSSCDLCPPGTFSRENSTSCDPCQPGSVSSINGSSACTLCAPGSKQPQRGKSACLPCDPGREAKQKNRSSTPFVLQLCVPHPKG